MIRFQARIEDPARLSRGNLPRTAVKLSAPASMEEMMKKSWPIVAALCLVLAGCMFVKCRLSHAMVIHPLAVPLGLLVGFALLPVHEWLHGVVYPAKAQVTIGRLKGRMIFVALASYPLQRARFVAMCLLPFVLGLVPLVLFALMPAGGTVLNGLLFGMACMGMVSPYPDVYNTLVALRQTNPRDAVMFYGDDLYKIPYVPHAARHRAL